MNMSDSLIIAPMSLFHPSVLEPLKPGADIFKENTSAEDTYIEELLAEATGAKPKPTLPNTSKAPEEEDRESEAPNTTMPLDKAILLSLERIGKKELRKKLCSTVLLVGGSSLFPSLREMLEARLGEAIPSHWDVQRIDILEGRRKDTELDRHFAVWRGAAIIASLDNIRDVWVTDTEWNLWGEKALREKTTFW
jgi:actin-related protein 8